MTLGHKKLAYWYLQLAQNLDGGMVLARALAETRGPPAEDLAKMVRWVEGGGSVAQAFDLASDWISESERPFLVAAATAGKLPMALRRLSDRHLLLRKNKLKLLMECAYPALTFNFALVVLPIMLEMGSLSFKSYFGMLALTAGPILALEAIAAVLVLRQHPLADQILDRLPLICRFRQAQRLADFTVTLGHLLEAGVIIGDAWLIASQTSHSPDLRQAGLELREVILKGEPPGLQLHRFPCFPTEYVGLYRTGELSGQLDQNLRLLAEQSQESADRMLKVSVRIYTGVAFGIVAVMVAWMAIFGTVGYWKMITNLSGGM
jgi:type II secretory pathway component PulF